MNKESKRTEGIVLHSLPFRDFDRIITLFTKEIGIVKAIIPKSLSTKTSHSAHDPLTQGEFVLKPGKSNLYRCEDLSILNQNLQLRKNLTLLQTGCEMAKTISFSQLEGKPAPKLYNLLISYLSLLPQSPSPHNLLSSFTLKLLRHDGLLHLAESCSQCHSPTSHLHLGESFCHSHKPLSSLPFSSEEISILQLLNLSRSTQALLSLHLPPPLKSKVKELFSQLFP